MMPNLLNDVLEHDSARALPKPTCHLLLPSLLLKQILHLTRGDAQWCLLLLNVSFSPMCCRHQRPLPCFHIYSYHRSGAYAPPQPVPQGGLHRSTCCKSLKSSQDFTSNLIESIISLAWSWSSSAPLILPLPNTKGLKVQKLSIMWIGHCQVYSPFV